MAVRRWIRRRARVAIVLAAAAVLAAAPAAAQAPFTLEDVLSAPFPSELVASPTGDRVGWVLNDGGARNIWVAEAPGWRGRQITSYARDDGQELGSLTFTPDGAAILFARGGAPNRQGDVPNPASDPGGMERAVWIVEVAGGTPRKLYSGGGLAISPAGTMVAFTRGADVMTVPLERPTEGEPEATKLLEVRRGAGSLTWSPDGSFLAFASNRDNHAFVGVYDLAAETLTWMAPSVDWDGSPAWSPDGRQIAFIRIPNIRGWLPFEAVRETEPFSVLVADPHTGEAQTVFTADPGPGSVFQRLPGESLMWGAGDRLVFPWEKSGWLHLWSVPAEGGRGIDLTPGEFEVQNVSLAPDHRTVLYDGNQGDIDRKHLWRVAVDGNSPPQALTSGEGLEWSPLAPREGVVAFLASGPTTPAHAQVLVAGERRELAPGTIPERFPEEHLVTPRQVVFPAADGLSVHGQLFQPPARCGGGPHPGLLFFHGGSRRQMLLGFHHRYYYHNSYAFNQYMAAKCYLVLSVNYRSGIGYGLEFREAPNYGAGGASEFQDVLGAGMYMARRDDVDPGRIGLWGGSYGGYLTALGLARASDLFAAGVDVHGVHDWNVVVRHFVPSYDPEAREEWARTAFESSPLADIDTWRSPVLLIHGDDDRNVPFSESVELVELLRERGVELEQLVFPDEVHDFLLHRTRLAAFRASAGFLDQHLKPGTAAGSR